MATDRQGSRKRLIATLAGIIVIILIAVAFSRRGGPPAAGPGASPTGATVAPPAPPVPVSVMSVSPGTVTRSLAITGQLQSDNRVNLTSKVAGRVARLPVTTGDRVLVGQLVAQLDDSDFVVQVHQAEAALQAAQASAANAQLRLDQARSGVGLKDVQTSGAIAQARANLAGAKSKLSFTIKSSHLEDIQADISVRQAKAALDSAKQNLSQVQEGSRQQEKAQAQSAVERAQADYDHAVTNFNRLDSLYKQGAIAQQSRDDASYAVSTAKAALDSAKQQASLVEAGSRSQQVAMAEEQVRQSQGAYDLAVATRSQRSRSQDEIDQAQEQVRQLTQALRIAEAGSAQYTLTRQDVRGLEAQVRQSQAQVRQSAAQLELARQQLGDTRITSPVEGVVDTRAASEGSYVAPTTVLMTITPTQGLYFEGQVPEDSIASIRVGDPVQTTVDAVPGHVFPGRVSEIIPVAESSSRTYRVHISVPNGNGQLPQNGYARGVITIGRVEGIFVPRTAIASAVGDKYVFVVENGKAVRRPVTLGYIADTQAQVASGLKPGEQVVVAGTDSLTNGASVTIKPDPVANTAA